MFQKITIVIIFQLISGGCFAEGVSALGLDYLKITKNEVLAEIMLDMEPKLIEYYQEGEYTGSTEYDRQYALKLTAHVLGIDRVSQDTYEVITSIAPDAPLSFLKLNKEKYPNLWNFGELERLKSEKEASMKLYRALHGKDYVEN